jgi:hypothetical protein
MAYLRYICLHVFIKKHRKPQEGKLAAGSRINPDEPQF